MLAYPCPYSNACSIRGKQSMKAIQHAGTGQRRFPSLYVANRPIPLHSTVDFHRIDFSTRRI
jgi:hypothetical protein